MIHVRISTDTLMSRRRIRCWSDWQAAAIYGKVIACWIMGAEKDVWTFFCPTRQDVVPSVWNMIAEYIKQSAKTNAMPYQAAGRNSSWGMLRTTLYLQRWTEYFSSILFSRDSSKSSDKNWRFLLWKSPWDTVVLLLSVRWVYQWTDDGGYALLCGWDRLPGLVWWGEPKGEDYGVRILRSFWIKLIASEQLSEAILCIMKVYLVVR